ncbi:hypothetical protein L8N14_020245, partial [Serratia marcescens]|nr:hypothetical protein [Serratia marcescens]
GRSAADWMSSYEELDVQFEGLNHLEQAQLTTGCPVGRTEHPILYPRVSVQFEVKQLDVQLAKLDVQFWAQILVSFHISLVVWPTT